MPLTREYRKSRSSLPLPSVADPYPLYTDTVPTITRGYTLTVSGTSYNANGPQFTWIGGKLSFIGATMVQAGASGADAAAGANRSFPFNPANTVQTGGQYRLRFATDAPEIMLHYAGAGGSDFAMLVDGKLLRSPAIQTGMSGGGGSYNGIKFAFDPITTDQEVLSASPSAGGTGYAEGDVVTLSGGTAGTAATFVVTRATAGVVNNVAPVQRGQYSATPANPASTTGGTGTGLTLTTTWRTKRAYRQRTVEFLFTSYVKVIGISVGAAYDVWPVPARGLRGLIVGDSLSEASVQDYAHGLWCYQAMRRLGIDDYAVFGLGSTGWVANSSGTRSTFPDRLAAVIAWAPDVLIVPGSSNDGTGTGVQAAATAFWLAGKAALPNCICIAMAPWTGTTGAITPQSNADANKAAALAAGISYIDSYVDGTTGWLRNGSNNGWILSPGDTIHPGQLGHDYYGLRAANDIRTILAA